MGRSVYRFLLAAALCCGAGGAARAATELEARKAIYRKVTERFLDKGWIFYLYHPQNLVTHTARLEGYRPVADGIIRVVGLKLK